MTWFMYHQRATDLIRERQREADQIRLAHLARLSEEDGLVPASHTALAGPRRAAARAILVVGRSATRLAEALDVENDPSPETAHAR
jgi:hypothetical protein